jgi:hypothetical protein
MTAFENFVTWEVLASFGGAVLMTALLTQALKGIKILANVPTRFVSYFLALIILVTSTYFTVGLTVSSAVLMLFNAFIVSFASNGAFDGVMYMIDKKTKDTARFDGEE